MPSGTAPGPQPAAAPTTPLKYEGTGQLKRQVKELICIITSTTASTNAIIQWSFFQC
jgi:hypothetical protein